MKSTGIVRKVDELGRVVIPAELRRTLDIEIKNSLEIYVESDRIILRKYQPSCNCVFCGDPDATEEYKGKAVCLECMSALCQKVC